ncbi:MAG: hypothetical protein DA328_00525 [Nitrososphaeraceae archaeon]|nr:hypothetical protein [Nitrososphaeraceae archaeon]
MYYNIAILFSFLFFLVFSISVPVVSFGQINSNPSTTAITPLHVFKNKNSEIFSLPFDIGDFDRKNSYTYKFDSPIEGNWILNIRNNLSYYDSPEVKTIIKLNEMLPSEKFIEVGMSGDQSRFWVGVNTNSTGYLRIYEATTGGWTTEKPMVISYGNNQGLTITNGKRIIIDRLSLDGFNLASLSIYGKEDSDSINNVYSGTMDFELFFGNPRDSPTYFLPFIMLGLVGGVLAILLYKKKRDS